MRKKGKRGAEEEKCGKEFLMRSARRIAWKGGKGYKVREKIGDIG